MAYDWVHREEGSALEHLPLLFVVNFETQISLHRSEKPSIPAFRWCRWSHTRGSGEFHQKESGNLSYHTRRARWVCRYFFFRRKLKQQHCQCHPLGGISSVSSPCNNAPSPRELLQPSGTFKGIHKDVDRRIFKRKLSRVRWKVLRFGFESL